MRNYDELHAAALASGSFAGYQGDGASVPWQVALPFSLPIGYTFWSYKAYLDSRWPEGFRLHDWTYTPYGSAIQVTQEESDLALREYIARDSVPDSLIVYASVATFGSMWFGKSDTGYSGPQSTRPTGNIELGTFSTRGASMPMKVVIVFQEQSTAGSNADSIGYVSQSRTGGWTEHVWYQSDNLAQLINDLKGPNPGGGEQPLLYARALCLPNNAQIVGVRIYQGGAGRGQYFPMGFKGSMGANDIPQMALLCAAISGGTNTVRRFTMRGVPDDQVNNGEFNPGPNFASNVNLYFSALTNFAFLGSAIVTKTPIIQIQDAVNAPGNGLVTFGANNPYAVGNYISINQTLDAVGIRRGGKFLVVSVGPMQQQITIENFPFAPTTGGYASMPSKQLFPFLNPPDNISVERVTTRRVGRPFGGYRGRRSRHRKIA